MGVPVSTRQAASNAVAALGRAISLHTGAGGGTNGANEATGGNYARQETVWTPTGTGSNNGVQVNIPCPPGTYTEGGIWSATSGGTFVGSSPFATGPVIVSGSGASINVTPSTSS